MIVLSYVNNMKRNHNVTPIMIRRFSAFGTLIKRHVKKGFVKTVTMIHKNNVKCYKTIAQLMESNVLK